MTLYALSVDADGNPTLRPATEQEIASSFQDDIREEALKEAAKQKDSARQSELAAHKFMDALCYLRRQVRDVAAGADIDDLVAMLNRTRGNIIDLEAVGGGLQVTPMPRARFPE